MTKLTFERIPRSRTRLADEVYEQLFGRIISGRIGPGDRLIQETIAEEMDISRTPVREALLRLEHEGIIQLAERRGFVVREIAESEVRDIYQAREAIEGFAARLVATAHCEVALDQIAEVVNREASTSHDTVRSAFVANEAAHRAIVEASGNGFLVQLFDVIWGRQVALRLYGDLLRQTDVESTFDHDHSSLLDSLRNGDGDSAELAMVKHIRAGLELQVRALDGGNTESAAMGPTETKESDHVTD
ncbi:MAG: GntR family transcriptional regulator [Actinomycetia bacterium]|nr:GntR family transcriptional regulator [Actinomycetes bacterium]MCP5035446.1 GntR family transcriptional regulator [Actinomycetes bacterium]